MFRHRIETSREIDADPDRVWAVLSDLGSYPDWNPLVRAAEGVLEPGKRIAVRLQPAGQRGMTLRPRLLRVEPGRALVWLGNLLVPGVFDGEHRFLLEPLPGGRTLLRHEETFRGWIVPLLRARLDIATTRGFEAMNEALARRAETSSDGP